MAGKGFDQKLVKRFDFLFDFDETKFNRFLAKAKLDLDSVQNRFCMTWIAVAWLTTLLLLIMLACFFFQESHSVL